MQVADGNMVRNESPTSSKEEEREEEMGQEIIAQPQGNVDNNVDEQMEYVEDEEYSNDINRYFENDAYSDIGIKALEDELDHLQTALDHLEKKNDNIHAELIDLLQSNREARKQFQESLQ